jgi:hypothetical protein
MIELLIPCGFDTLEDSWVKGTIGICMLVDYSVAKKCQHQCEAGLRQWTDRWPGLRPGPFWLARANGDPYLPVEEVAKRGEVF